MGVDAGDARVMPDTGQRIVRNTVVTGATTLATSVASFALLPYILDRVPDGEYGLWVLALSFSVTGGFLGLSELGLQQSLVRAVAECAGRDDADRRRSELASSAATLLTCIGLVAALGLVLGGLLIGEHIEAASATSARVVFGAIALDALITLPTYALAGTFEGLQRYAPSKLSIVCRQLVFIAGVLLVLDTGDDASTIAGCYAVASVAGAACLWVTFRRLVPEVGLSVRRVRRDALRVLLSTGGWLLLSRLAAVIFHQMDKAILAGLVATSLLAGYDVVVRIYLFAALVQIIAASAVMPAASVLLAGEEDERLRRLILRGTKYAALLATPAALGPLLLARPLLSSWVGEDFTFATFPLQLLLGGLLVVNFASVASSVLVATPKVRTLAGLTWLSVAANLVVSVALARRYELTGVVTGTVVSFLVGGPAQIALALRSVGIPARDFLRSAVLPVLPPSLVFATIVLLLRVTPLATSLAGLAVILGAATAAFIVVAALLLQPAERHQLVGSLRRAGGT